MYSSVGKKILDGTIIWALLHNVSLGQNEKIVASELFQALSYILFFNSLDTKKDFGNITDDH
jgi:hypothetical protein